MQNRCDEAFKQEFQLRSVPKSCILGFDLAEGMLSMRLFMES